jgi:hypothetical protein
MRASLWIQPVFLLPVAWSAPVEEKALPPPTALQIIERMLEADAGRSAALNNYTVTRRYVLDNLRFHKNAEVIVQMMYAHPGTKTFEIISEKGSKTVRNQVIRKLIDAEADTARDSGRSQIHVTPANYEINLLGTEPLEGRTCYVLDLSPKTTNKFLIRGRIWVDTQDFAIARIEGSPAKNPSIWTRKILFIHRYEKFGPFWLAVSNESKAEARIFGETNVTIEYFDYKINQPPQDASAAVSIP